jgi:dolichol-phosphate mannosyltransferase
VREWLGTRTEHLPLTILTSLLIIVGFQLFFMGILGDAVASMHREVLREIYKNQKKR